MIDLLLRAALLVSGIIVVFAFIGFGLFFFGWVFSRDENGW